MRNAIAWWLAAMAASCTAAGCSSIRSFDDASGPPEPYAGARDAGGSLAHACYGDPGYERDWNRLMLPLIFGDFVGSAVFDTLILPVTATAQRSQPEALPFWAPSLE